MKTDGFLLRFYDRLTDECKNMKYRDNNAVITRLEETIGQHKKDNPSGVWTKDKYSGALALEDSAFHIELFEISGDKEMCRKLRVSMASPDSPHIRIWRSICHNKNHKDMLLESHDDIINCIKKMDVDGAVTAMQKHFAIILPHYSTLFQQ